VKTSEASYQRVRFRLYQMLCCGQMLCWLNPRHPNYCPECGTYVFPDIKGWSNFTDEEALLQLSHERS
jgi:hypothetical protein